MGKLSITRKVLMLSLTMLAASPVGAFAQEGLFQHGVANEPSNSYIGSTEKTGFLGYRNEQATGTIDNQIFGQPVPLGSGLVILLAAGAGYAALKRKEDEQ